MADETARWAGAIVVLHGGKRLGWKIHRGAVPSFLSLAERYLGGYPACEVSCESRRFDDPDAFDKAQTWCASFPAHPDERGSAPQRRTTDG